MISKSTILSTAERIDAIVPKWSGAAATNRRIVSLLFHSLYLDHSEPEAAGVYPHERMTIAVFRQLIESLLSLDYAFVSPTALLNCECLPDKSVVLTFDDGYFTFVRALPVLHEYQIPVCLFVSPGFCVDQHMFWWDAVYRGGLSAGGNESRIRRQLSELRKQPYVVIRDYVRKTWGPQALAFKSDVDRPLRVDELKEIARDPLVQIANHTYHHTALPFRTPHEMEQEIKLAEDWLREELSIDFKLISYPNGDYGNEVIRQCARLNYQFGMTLEPRWTLPADTTRSDQRLAIGRYMPSGDRDPVRQVHSLDRPLSLSSWIRRFKKHKFD